MKILERPVKKVDVMKTNKILSILMVVVLLVLLASCGCKHEWKAATCTEPQTCTKCGKTEGNALGHKYGEEKVLVEPTCSETGVMESICTVCGDKKTTKISATNDHEWKAASCTEPQTCTKCGATQGKAAGHKFSGKRTLQEPTCTKTGLAELICMVCGEKKTTEIPALGHEWVFVNIEKEATCTETGKENYKCSICGDTRYKTIAKLSHQYKDGYCTVCFAKDPKGVKFNPSSEEKEQIDKIDTIGDREIRKEENFYYLLFSFYDEDNNAVVAPCVLEMRIVNDKGETVYKAKRIVETSDFATWSNDNRKRILASPKIMRSDILEGLSSNGTIYFTVKFVDTYFKEYGLEISGLPVHSFEKEEILLEATCGTVGLVRKTCSICGKVVEEIIPATGRHVYRKGTVAIESTCLTEGLMNYACIVCGTIGRTEKIEKLGHSFVDDICTDCGTRRIGSKGPAGGFIFYDCDLDNLEGNEDGLMSSECGWRFLEAAPANVGKAVFGYYRHSANNENLFVNGDTNYYEENCTRTGIGYGKSNTEMLVDAMESEAYVKSSGSEKTENYAAKLCADYTLNGYDDWFLPSKNELNLMYENLHKQGLGSFADDYYFYYYYWSSSELSNNDAWEQLFNPGAQYSDDRNGNYFVRPVRAF